MSDAQDSKHDGDEPVEERTAPDSDNVPAPEQATPDESSNDRALGDARAVGTDETTAADAPRGDDGITRTGRAPDTTVFNAGAATAGDPTADGATADQTPADDAPGADAGVEAAAVGSGAEPVANATEEGSAMTAARDADGSGDTEEPDYEALAAELDRLEAETAVAAPVAPGAAEPTPAEKAADPWFEPAKTETFSASEPAPVGTADADDQAVPVAVAPAPGPIFVQAPEPPRKRGNRGASGLIGLVAALSFGVLYAAADYAWQLFLSFTADDGVVDPLGFVADVLLQPPFWFTVVAFWLSFWLLGVFVNRARWWSWVIFGLLVAVLTYAGYIGGVFLDAPFWNVTAGEGMTLLANSVFTPMALIALILAREVTIWFGAWVSRRGAKVARLNEEEREEYDKIMAEGPKAS